MIDFDPNTQEALLSQDLAMKFLVWAASVAGACAQMMKAKQLGEPCPFSEASLNELFGTRKKI